MTSGVKQGEGALGTPFMLIQHTDSDVCITPSHMLGLIRQIIRRSKQPGAWVFP